jgi:hypothetical protein
MESSGGCYYRGNDYFRIIFVKKGLDNRVHKNRTNIYICRIDRDKITSTDEQILRVRD